MTTIASRFAIIHRNRFLRKCFIHHFEALPRNPMDFSRLFEMTVSCHSEAFAEESCVLGLRFFTSFHFAQNDTSVANKAIAGIRKISEFAKFKNRVKIRILPANARKNIV